MHERTWGTVLSIVASWMTRSRVMLFSALDLLITFRVPFASEYSLKWLERAVNQRGGGGDIGDRLGMNAQAVIDHAE